MRPSHSIGFLGNMLGLAVLSHPRCENMTRRFEAPISLVVADEQEFISPKDYMPEYPITNYWTAELPVCLAPPAMGFSNHSLLNQRQRRKMYRKTGKFPNRKR